MDVTGRVIAGRYVIRQLIGEGGMATIFAAHDQQLNRDVAIKLLRPQFSADPAFAARFRQEARSAGSLDHPNIVSVFDYGVDRDMNFIVMELIHGRDLAAVLAERGPLPVPEALKIASGVGAALEAAHRQGIVHRDVKPGNILLADDGTVKVVDFGIARALSAASVTVTGTILGSVQYFSPEQARGEEATGRSDIYSLGIVLYEMLTARLPFEGESPIGIAFRRLTEEPPPASQFRPDLPTEVIALLDRLLQRDPSDRLPDAAALSAALAAALVMPRRLPEAAEAEPAVGVMTIAPAGTLRAPPSLREAPVAARYRAMRAPLVPPLGGPSRPAGPDAGVGEWRIAAGGELPERRRRNAAWLIPALCLLIVAAFGAFAWLTPERRPDVVAGLASASPAVDPTPDPTAEPAGTPAPTAEPSPDPTPEPSPEAMPEPTPPPTTLPTAPPPVQPTEAPAVATVQPTEAPAVTEAPILAAGAAETVTRWYELVSSHNFDMAVSYWSDNMRARCPPDECIYGRFAGTESIALHRAEVIEIDESAGRARVAVELTEDRGADTRSFQGSWDLIRTTNGWLLNREHF